MFSHADMLTRCPLDANNIIIKFRAHRRSIYCYPPRVSRETLGGDEHGLFVVDEDFFIVCTRHACGRVHSIFFSSVARPLASTPICCSILQYTKRTKPSADTWAIDPWVGACGAFFSLRVLVSKCMRPRWWCVSCGNRYLFYDIYQVPHASTRRLLL